MPGLGNWSFAKLFSRRPAGAPAARRGLFRTGPTATLPPPLFDLRDRLTAVFDLDELRELAFGAGIEPDTVPEATRQLFALGLARAAWCRGLLDELLAAAAERRPLADWAIDRAALPLPPAGDCERDPLPRPTIFSDWKQVVALLLVLLGVAVGAAYGWAISRRPAEMDAKFNVAVAEFALRAMGDETVGDNGRLLRDHIAGELRRELIALQPEDIAIGNVNMWQVNEADEAERLADDTGAHLVIWGEGTLNDGMVAFWPNFYVSPSLHYDVGEMAGDHYLKREESVPLAALRPGQPDAEGYTDDTAMLGHFTQALVALAAGDHDGARGAIEEAVALAEAKGPFPGRETIYLFASHIARLQALDLDVEPDTCPPAPAANPDLLAAAERRRDEALVYAEKARDNPKMLLPDAPDYNRALLALGSIYFDRGDLAQARAQYELAQSNAIAGATDEAFVSRKANIGLGNVYLEQLRFAVCHNPEDSAGHDALAIEALRQYALAQQLPAAPEPLQEALAGEAWLNSGLVHEAMNRAGEAVRAYCEALARPVRLPVANLAHERLALLAPGGACGGES